MADKYHIKTDYYDLTTGAQMKQYTDFSEVNEHANAELGWEEHLEQVTIPEEDADLQLRWWEYSAAPKAGRKNALVVSFFEYYNSSWQQVADREGITVVAFEYHKNSRLPEGGRGTLGFGPRPDEIATYHKVIEDVINKYDCDRERLYLSGLSYGDMTAVIYAAKYGKEYAGICLMNGPSSFYNLDRFGMRDQAEIPSMQLRSDDDYTCDGFPWKDYSDAAGAKAYVKDIRSLQTVMNRDIWMKANGISSYLPKLTSERYYVFADYQGAPSDVIYTELFGHCHIVPIDAAEVMWTALFSRYKRNAEGAIEKTGAPALTPDKNIALAAGCDKAYVNNELVQLPAACIMVQPWDQLCRDSFTYHQSEDIYESLYAPVEILKLGFGLDYTAEDRPQTLQTAIFGKLGEGIELRDSVVRFNFNGKTYEIMTDTNMVLVDGKVTDLERPLLWINGQLYVPAEEVAALLGYFSSKNEDTVYITDHKVKLGYTIGRLIREEILSERDENPTCSIELMPCENGSAELSAECVMRGDAVYVTTAPADGFELESVEAFINGCNMPTYKLEDNKYYICNIMKDITVKVSFIKK